MVTSTRRHFYATQTSHMTPIYDLEELLVTEGRIPLPETVLTLST